VENIHPKNDLFERARRHRPDDDGIETIEAAEVRPFPENAGSYGLKIDSNGFMAEELGGALEIADVPTCAVTENGPTMGRRGGGHEEGAGESGVPAPGGMHLTSIAYLPMTAFPGSHALRGNHGHPAPSLTVIGDSLRQVPM
jgi:hypothetical protein